MKRAIFIIVVLILVAILGVFIWRIWGNPAIDTGIVRFEEFEIRETASGKVISHEETGLSLSIPLGWEILDGGNSFSLKSPVFEIDEENSKRFFMPVPKSGCAFNIKVERSEEIDSSEDRYSSYQGLKDTIDWCEEYLDECEYELVKINSITSTKHVAIVTNDSLLGSRILLEVPKNENIYAFEAYLFGKDKEQCEKEFDKILGTVKIK